MSVTFDFAEVSIPERTGGPGRPAEPNPFLDKVAELVTADGEPRDVAVEFLLDEDIDSEAVGRVKRQLARAGIVHNVSVFKRVEDTPDGVRVTFWAQNRIIPVRKPKEESNGASAEVEDSAGDEDGEQSTEGYVSAPSGVTTLTP